MGKRIGQTSCKYCSSSDAVQIYEQEDGSRDGYCFSCNKVNYFNDESRIYRNNRYNMKNNQLTKDDVNILPYRGESDRKVDIEVNKRYGIKSLYNETTREIEAVFYPYYIKDKLSGYKCRVLPKDFESIGSIGSIRGVDPFGWNLINYENKNIVITEGEEDCLAVSHVLWKANGKKKFPNVISLVNGADVKCLESIKKDLDKFEKIIACFDGDEAGKKALDKLGNVITPSKIFKMELPDKDASECLQKGLEKEIKESYLNAKLYKPDAIISIGEAYDILYNSPKPVCISYPEKFKKLNQMTYGMRLGDLDVYTAGEGIGKTQFFRELIFGLFRDSSYNIGVLSLEESLQSLTDGLRGLYLNKRIHLPDIYNKLTDKDKKESWDFIKKDNRLYLYGHFGSLEDIGVLNAIRYLATINGCKFIFLDHLSIVVSEDASKGDERTRIDSLMTKLRCLAQNLQIWIGVIVHLSRPQGQKLSWDEGLIPTKRHLRGSGAIGQLANTVIALQRNVQHSNPEMRHVFCIHVLKNRFSGETGEADYIKYDTNTGRLLKIPKPVESIIEISNLEDISEIDRL